MKSFLTLPKEQNFYQIYAKFSIGIGLGVGIAQIISAFTESGIIYSAVYESALIFGDSFAQKAGIIGAILGVLMIEIAGLRFFLPKAVDSFLYRRWKGLHAWMSTFILIMTLLLVAASFLLSYKGKKSVIQNVLSSSESKEQVAIDSAYTIAQKTTLASFDIDSAVVAQSYQLLMKNETQKFNSKKEVAQQNFDYWSNKAKNSGRNYSTRINDAKSKIKQIEANRANKLTELENAKFAKMEVLKTANNRSLDSLQNVFTQTTISNQNHFEEKAQLYDSGGAWIVFVAIAFSIVGIILKRIFLKGSGIEEKPISTDYFFRPSIVSEAWEALTERVQQESRQMIADFSAKTKVPPLPSTPHALLDVASYTQPTYNWEIMPPLPKGNTDDLENKITSYAESIVILEEKNLHEQAQEMRLQANQVIKTYLERNGQESTKEEIESLHNQVVEFVNGTTKENPFSIVRRQIGFNKNIPNDNRNNDNRSNENSNLRVCKNCGQSYVHKHHKQMYCKTECRITFWENKTGKKLKKGRKKK